MFVTFKRFKTLVGKQIGEYIKVLRSDGGRGLGSMFLVNFKNSVMLKGSSMK